MSDKTKFLITGSSGFIGKHFIQFLDNSTINAEVIGVDIVPSSLTDTKSIVLHEEMCTMNDSNAVQLLLQKHKPDYIVHFASQSSVAKSWDDISTTFYNNVNSFITLAESVRQYCSDARMLVIGSSEEYGNVAPDNIPIKETCPLHPQNPYAIARVAQEMLAKMYVQSFGLDIVMTRSFNHIGPGQSEAFAIPSFVKQIVTAKKSNTSCTLKTGNIDVVRDFIDVRDAVKAYYLLLYEGMVGEVYNICSGVGHSLRAIITMLSEITSVHVVIEHDQNKMRPTEVQTIIGSYQKINKLTGWSPTINIHQSLEDIVKGQSPALM